jgi:DNA modification methylase
MDWRHMRELHFAIDEAQLRLINLCVWAKTNGGMGSLYRSQHELVAVLKNGTAPHINNVELGKHGRYRTNVWSYAGANTFRKGRDEDLADHPTVKPVGMIADAIKDCSNRGHIVLDPFGGSGSTLLAAERTGRCARLIELEPHYVDLIIRRWQALSGEKAVHAKTGQTFEDRREIRTDRIPSECTRHYEKEVPERAVALPTQDLKSKSPWSTVP